MNKFNNPFTDFWLRITHQWIWSGDTLMEINEDNTVLGSHIVDVRGDVVRLRNGNPLVAIRRDLPWWDADRRCWVYKYGM